MDALVKTLLLVCLLIPTMGAASARTQNFIVTAPTKPLANSIAKAAEEFRHSLAIEWLGRPLPNWHQPCPIVANVDPRRPASGRTSFMFERRVPFGWDMEVNGSRERVLDSVLPHEVTHTIFATHFGRPLPRWADEGACTTVEHHSERLKQHASLIRFLKTERGIPFNQMFAMTEYPRDMLPLYSQGFSLTRYLIAQGGKQKFVQFIGMGLDSGNWPASVQQHYGYPSLGQLQIAWVDWVIQGSRDELAGPGTMIASANGEPAPRDRSQSESTAPASPQQLTLVSNETPLPEPAPPGRRPLIDASSTKPLDATHGETIQLADARTESATAKSWYARRRQQAQPAAATPNQIAANDSMPWTPGSTRRVESQNQDGSVRTATVETTGWRSTWKR